ncbi:tRNA pseudouridine55 synthase [Sporothrix schenckii 1099-18]|uniref:tRNA pseudouridine(55) synthase n=2 Tax=Sporothrix schenckii TaxID=29908 RepID=U7Q4I1_SPOS1|nr:tRNA pseudouridine55 synthase [Sporothrix schenckii 1099-18]ERT02082.1 tRNA pseudouridine(55) synthase [Sporothrix schenckii ATCC 58251]KJR80713.1 tRNA pseudouridine55 synthase [Sporothrix schenckii 1099-18]
MATAINKPMGMSSAQVIRDCQTYFNPSSFFRPLIQHEADIRARESNAAHRRRSKAKRDSRVKMGHGGTLDPLATGVLILGVGHGTKELNKFLTCTKTYETVVLFGASTDTYDRVGRILTRRPYDEITKEKVEEALNDFRGTFRQMPPLYSALKMNGKPLYEYAREGLSIPREIETREVEVSDLELVEWYGPGEHDHRWPAEEAGMAEQSLAERVWRQGKEQATGKKMTPEEEKSDIEALAAHEAFKRRAEEKQDELVFDKPSKRRRGTGGVVLDHHGKRRKSSEDTLMMSGALGELPSSPYDKTSSANPSEAEAEAEASPKLVVGTKLDGAAGRQLKMQVPGGRGSNLIPTTPPALHTPPPWEGKGPPAARIRLTVSSGFYVRSFCHDLGVKVSSAAMMAELARTRQSDFRVGSANVLEYDDISKGETVWAPKVERLLRLWKDGTVEKGADASFEQVVASQESAETKDAPVEEAQPADKEKPKTEDDSQPSAVFPTPGNANAEKDEEEWNGIEDDETVEESTTTSV